MPDNINPNIFLNPAGSVDYNAMQKAVSAQAGKIGTVGGPTSITTESGIPGIAGRTIPIDDLSKAFGAENLPSKPSEYHPRVDTHPSAWGWRGRYYEQKKTPRELEADQEAYKGQLRAYGGIQDWLSDRDAMQKEAGKSAEALKMMGASTEVFMRNLQNISEQVGIETGKARADWEAAVGKADEYVAESRRRVGESLDTLDRIYSDISKNQDFAKSHAMQASVQGVLGGMETEGRSIAERFGRESKEYEQFVGRKQTTLATVQSNIHASYAQLRQAQDTSYLNATSEALWKHNMYTSYQEQQHVETLRYMAQASSDYDIQVSQFQLGVEQLKMSGMENLANWIVQSPTYTMDIQPLMNLIAQTAA